MSEQQTVVAESSPAPVVMEVERGPLVNLTSEQRTEFRKTGELPKSDPQPKTEEPAPSDPPKEAEADAGDPPPPKTAQERSERDKAKAAKRFTDLLEENKRLKADLESRKPAEPSSTPEPSPAQPQHPPTRPKPTADDKKADGTPRFDTYEDFVEDLADWKGEQREAKNARDRAKGDQAKSFNAKLDEARTRYDNFDEAIAPFAKAIDGLSPVVREVLNESDYLTDLAFTVGSSDTELANFLKMPPGKQLRYIALTESLIAQELDGKNTPAAEEPPAKPKTQAPRPPSEAGGRAASPPDAEFAAVKANDYRAAKAEFTRKALAKLKT